MVAECEHEDGTPIGKCAICERTVCTECYRTVFSETICDAHEALEEESEWELIGFYTDAAAPAQRRYILEDNGVTSLVVEADADMIELYVPVTEKEDAFAALQSSADDSYFCEDCQIQYSKDLGACPLCGIKSEEHDEFEEQED
jgi:hypothetical protein